MNYKKVLDEVDGIICPKLEVIKETAGILGATLGGVSKFMREPGVRTVIVHAVVAMVMVLALEEEDPN